MCVELCKQLAWKNLCGSFVECPGQSGRALQDASGDDGQEATTTGTKIATAQNLENLGAEIAWVNLKMASPMEEKEENQEQKEIK